MIITILLFFAAGYILGYLTAKEQDLKRENEARKSNKNVTYSHSKR